jgi:hypothetical protein
MVGRRWVWLYGYDKVLRIECCVDDRALDCVFAAERTQNTAGMAGKMRAEVLKKNLKLQLKVLNG